MREFYEINPMAFFLFCFVYYSKTFKNWDFFLNGDPAYSVLPFSMEECFGGGRNERKSFFSHNVSRTRIPIENTFLS